MLALYLNLKNWFTGEEGQDLIEYALIIALVVVAAVVGLSLMGTRIGSLWSAISAWLQGIALPAAS